jgi:capsular polysaccharide biosynthesis protein
MELREYLKIFKNNLLLFLITVLVIIAIGVGYKEYQNYRPKTYQVSLLVNVTRTGIQSTDAYRYDDFYRLQADERFADTVVQWLKSPRVVTNIYNEVGKVSGNIDLKELSRFFTAKRLSSQVIEVDFSSGSAIDAQDTSVALVGALNQEAKLLNQSQKEDSWFKVVGDEPVIKEYKIQWRDVLPISIILGLFLGIWAVLLKHYLFDTNKK